MYLAKNLQSTNSEAKPQWSFCHIRRLRFCFYLTWKRFEEDQRTKHIFSETKSYVKPEYTFGKRLPLSSNKANCLLFVFTLRERLQLHLSRHSGLALVWPATNHRANRKTHQDHVKQTDKIWKTGSFKRVFFLPFGLHCPVKRQITFRVFYC